MKGLAARTLFSVLSLSPVSLGTLTVGSPFLSLSGSLMQVVGVVEEEEGLSRVLCYRPIDRRRLRLSPDRKVLQVHL